MEIELLKVADENCGGNTLKGFMKFDLDRCIRSLGRITIINELSFRYVEVERFQAYSKDLKPRFNIHSRHIMLKDVIKIYKLEQNLLMNLLKSQLRFASPLIHGYCFEI